MKTPKRDRPNGRSSPTKRKKPSRTTSQQKRREQQIVISLLVVIAVLIGFVIALLPPANRGAGPVPIADQSVPRQAPETPVEPRLDGNASDEPVGGDGARRPAPGTADGLRDDGPDASAADEPTETYPADEERPAETQSPSRNEALWWLPPTETSPSEWGTLYLVLDDAGRSLDELRAFLDLPYQMAIAVLPRREYSIESALAIAASGNEVLLHQPMEPVGSADPGPGAIIVGMSAAQVRSTLLTNLESVPGAVGVNNHMGSRATGDENLMYETLVTLDGQGLFFVDSRTSAKSVARAVATRLALPFAERNVFLDNVRERDAILESMRLALDRAHAGESVVMIGHVTAPVLAETLRQIHPVLAERGYYFGSLSTAVSVPRIAEDAE